MHLKVQNAATDLLYHAFQAAPANYLNGVVVHDHARLDVQTIDFVRTLLKFKSPVSFLSILSGVFGPRCSFNVKACRFYCQLSVNDESEDSLFLVVDTNCGREIMPERQLG